jgi:hypothetical protein
MGASTWTTGTISGQGIVTNLGTLTISGTVNKTLSAGLYNAGTITMTGTATTTIAGGVVLANLAGGVIDLQGSGFGGGAGGRITNAGTVRAAGGGIATAFENLGGAFDVQSGTFNLTANGVSSFQGGTFKVASGATLQLSVISGSTLILGGNLTSDATSTGGTLRFFSGTNVTRVAPGGVTFNFDPAKVNFDWSSGDINAQGGGITNAATGRPDHRYWVPLPERLAEQFRQHGLHRVRPNADLLWRLDQPCRGTHRLAAFQQPDRLFGSAH